MGSYSLSSLIDANLSSSSSLTLPLSPTVQEGDVVCPSPPLAPREVQQVSGCGLWVCGLRPNRQGFRRWCRLFLGVLEPAILRVFGVGGQGIEMKLVPVAQAQKRDGNLVWGGEWLSAGSKPPENSQAYYWTMDPSSKGLLTQVRLASQRLPCSLPFSVSQGHGRGGRRQ